MVDQLLVLNRIVRSSGKLTFTLSQEPHTSEARQTVEQQSHLECEQVPLYGERTSVKDTLQVQAELWWSHQQSMRHCHFLE